MITNDTRTSAFDERASQAYWETTHFQPRWRLPSRLDVGTSNILNLLARHVKPGMRVLEIGCAPGKHMAYLAKVRQAQVSGLDYSEPGIAFSKELFSRLGLKGQFHCENALATTFPENAFDIVYSLGVIEHFDDPRPIIEKHLLLAKDGGLVLITVPNYAGFYGSLQRYFDPENLKIHNLDVMNCEALAALPPRHLTCEVVTYRRGRLCPWLVHLQKRWPKLLSMSISYALNAAGLVQPFDIDYLCPMLVLSIRKQRHTRQTAEVAQAQKFVQDSTNSLISPVFCGI